MAEIPTSNVYKLAVEFKEEVKKIQVNSVSDIKVAVGSKFPQLERKKYVIRYYDKDVEEYCDLTELSTTNLTGIGLRIIMQKKG